MIFDLGQSVSSFEWIRVTAEYSNAVLVAVLPYVSDVAQKLDLPIKQPVSSEQVLYCSIPPMRRVEAEIGIKGDWYFAFSRGYIRTIQSDHSYTMLQDPDKIPAYYGKIRMSKSEAVQLARTNLTRLGIPLESVFAEQEPQVSEPPKFGTNVVPVYKIAWASPRGGTSVEIEVNADAKRAERIHLSSNSLDRPPPKVDVVPPHDPRFPKPLSSKVNPNYAEKLAPFVLRAVDEYGKKLSLPIPRPLTTNHVAKFSLQENIGGPYCTLELTNGWEFLYEGNMVTEFRAPDNLFQSEKRVIHIKDLGGKWNLTEPEAVELVKRTIAKFNYPTNLVHFEVKPQVSKPAIPGIPRYMFYWNYSPEGYDVVQTAISAEVDAGKGELKSLYYGHEAFGHQGPKIDVPITLPPESENNIAPGKNSGERPPKAPMRPLTPFAPATENGNTF